LNSKFAVGEVTIWKNRPFGNVTLSSTRRDKTHSWYSAINSL